MRILGFQLLLLLLSVTSASEDHLVPPPMSAAREEGATIARTRSGQTRWRNRWTMERTMVDSKPVIRFTEVGEGMHSPFTEEVRWTISSAWTDGAPPVPMKSESAYFDSSGKVLARQTTRFDFLRKQATIDSTDPKTGKTKHQTQSTPADTLGIDGIAGILRGLDFARTTPLSAHLLTNEPRMYDVTLEIRGTEKIQTANGPVECYKVELVPHLGVLNVVRFLYPRANFWFRVDGPHKWARYEGLENGPGSPEIVMELSSLR